MRLVVWPLDGRLSQLITVKGAMPAALRRSSAATMMPGALTRRVGIGEVVDDIGMARVELAGRRIVAIALFGHRQRDDADGGRGHQSQQLVALGIGVEHVEDRADDARMGARGVADGDGVEEVLRGQRILGVGPAEAGADDAPVGSSLPADSST